MLKKFKKKSDIKVGMDVYYSVYDNPTMHEVIEDIGSDFYSYRFMTLSDCYKKFSEGYLYYEDDAWKRVSNDLNRFCDDESILNKKVFEVIPQILEYLESKYNIKEK